MSLANSPQTADDILPLLNQLPEHEKVALLQRLTFSVPLKLNEGKYTEIYKGRLIEVYQYKQGWVSCYSETDGRKVDQGDIHDTAEECLKATHIDITWEIDQDEIIDSFRKLMHRFKAKGFTEASILNGLSEALIGMFDKSTWQKKISDALVEGVRLAWLPGRRVG